MQRRGVCKAVAPFSARLRLTALQRRRRREQHLDHARLTRIGGLDASRAQEDAPASLAGGSGPVATAG